METREQGNRLRDLSCEFFVMFAQFEFAMKEAGFLKVGRGRAANSDWDTLAKNEKIKNLFSQKDDRLDKAVKYYQEDPPQRQVVVEGKLAFEVVKPEHQVAVAVLGALRRVRNNLFHGGKLPRGPLGNEPQRDLLLIQHGITILENCVTALPRLESAFEATKAYAAVVASE